MPRSTVSSIAISTRSSSHFTVRIACLHILKSPYTSGAFLVRHSLYELNRIGDKQQPCLTSVPNFTCSCTSVPVPNFTCSCTSVHTGKTSSPCTD
jgi:hypothetical protein